MAVELRLPKLSDEMKEGIVSHWLKQPGDAVRKGEPVVEVETEKVIVEVEAPSDGILLEICAAEQEVVPVNGLLCRIGQAGEAAGTVESPALGARASPAAASAAQRRPAPAESAAAASSRAGSQRPGPERGTAAPARELDDAGEEPPMPRAGRSAGSNVVPLVQPGAGEDAGAAPPATPLARRIAAELGIDLSRIQGSGIGGKIVKTDLQPYLSQVVLSQAYPVARGFSGASPAELPLVIASSRPAMPALAAYVELPHTPLRRTVARRMAESKQQIPHFYMTTEIDVTEALAVRQQLNEASERKVTVNDLLIKAAAWALEKVPEVNAEYTEQAVRRFSEAHIGFAVAIAGGLVTPVVRDCHLKSIGRIAADTAELIARAKARKLHPRELEGGTFTISNMGMFDVVEFAAIINPPQVAILAVARPQEKPVVVDGRILVRSRLQATISADHRALDGVTAAAFLRELKAALEQPVRLML